ncbi:hypothetical protein AC579_7186 [Pseudocercospora musae]|uniref:Hcy-binding domain-containing protein n=1 Tax=Pseudocercospora musae TaxID=113226 RepID=A0A139I434_9PEZI|nr:hypothetical protein AC579_7186 [Pseudocercospora musae]
MATSAAVIGGGPCGLMALKNLQEDGFDAAIYESRDWVGGLWKYSTDDALSTAENTIFNTSKYRAAVTDFPMPDDNDFPTAPQLYTYWNDYCNHFQLWLHIKLDIVSKDDQTQTQYFHKVAVSTGPFAKPKQPKLDGTEKFSGTAIHGIKFHEPEKYTGKNVVIISKSTISTCTLEIHDMAAEPPRCITILDGGMSRELIRLGAPFHQPEWSALALIEAPEYVRQVHLEFARAGADVITTNTYALVPFHLGEERFRSRGKELAQLAGRLAREAADEVSKESGRKIRVSGSLPPIFGSYEPEKFNVERVHEYLHILVEALEPYVDIWLGETLSVIKEAQAVKTAVANTGKPLWISFCPDDAAPADLCSPRLRSGELIADTVEWAVKSGVEALLYNCCRPNFAGSAMGAAKQELSKHSASMLSLGVYANTFVSRSSGSAANVEISATDASLDADVYATDAQSWVRNGASIVGGCCGVGVRHIERLSALLKAS